MSWSSIIKREELESIEVLPFDLPDFSDAIPVGSIFLPEEHRSFPSARGRAKEPPAGTQEAPPAEERTLVKEEVPAPPAPQPAVEVTEELKRKLFEQGYEQGQRVGQELAEKKIEPVISRFEEATGDLNELRSRIIRRSERNIVDLALEISQKIIQRELSLDPEILVDMIRSALADFEGQDEITIRVGPDDHQYLSTAKSSLVEGDPGIKDIHIQVDESISEGGCMIEAHFGKVDLRIDKQLQEIARSMGMEKEADVESAVEEGGEGSEEE